VTMRDCNYKLTLCEVLRQINDVVQDDDVNSQNIRDMLALAERMGKKMSAKLHEYNENYDAGFWRDNSKLREHVYRTNHSYKIGSDERAGIALERLTK